ncbi:DUF5991 domain-containing protein [Caulobacter endophyticus]|uniref:DUF5991 domain-containing protein n=1 Tax=Caulobacter endophyticus TaxID=2172652 RepID=UPI0024105DF3|nr:DUF5991 domain-containing protein [Caulobacter endophyticus]MDG2530720.1 DUF5991 domain-containing protein [Caulobacter endophyticus]
MFHSMSAGVLALMLSASAPAGDWNGVYSYTHDGGRTAGGSPILVTWRLELKGAGCRFHGEGFQTQETFRCSTHATPEGLEVRFLAYPPPSAGNRFGVEVYKPGAPLFTLSKLQGRVLTRWTGFVPDEGVVRSPAPYFRKVR